MLKLGDRTPEDDEACRLVGRFLKHFSVLETAMDKGLGKLLGLEQGVVDILSTTIPFAQKVNTSLSAENLLAALPEKQRVKAIKGLHGAIYKLNDKRKLFAHLPFVPMDSGVKFRRVIANGKYNIMEELFTATKIDELCLAALTVASELDGLIETMKPYEASTDFRDVRNSQYLPLL